MKFAAGATLLAALTLMGCMGPDGNPNRQPYANEPGGAIAVKSATVGTVSYDPYAAAGAFHRHAGGPGGDQSAAAVGDADDADAPRPAALASNSSDLLCAA